MTVTDCRGIEVAGDFSERGSARNWVEITIVDQRRIAAVHAAARRLLRDDEPVVAVLDEAVRFGFPDIELPPIEQPEDALVLAKVLDHVSNGNDGAPARAAAALRFAEEETRSRTRTCPFCDGTGEVCD